MVQRKPTPEEQLLKLIEGGNGAVQTDAPASAPKSKSKSFASVGKIPGFLDYAKKLFAKSGTSFRPGIAFDIKNLNRVLLGLVAASAIFLVVDLLFFKPEQNNFLAQVSTSDAVFPGGTNVPEKISQDIATYKTSIQKRNPFLPPDMVALPGPADSGKSTGGGVPTIGTGSVSEALQGIKLVGISWSDNPLALIEDVSTGRTYFLRKGQEMKGIKIQDISKEKVIVTYQGQEGELF